MKGIIYYSDGLIEEPIKSMAWESIKRSGMAITMSIKPSDEPRSYLTMLSQIIYCLERSVASYVFFCEHDVIYNPTHFEFTPTRDDIFYYNNNVWRWDYPKDRYITYDRLISLSGMCCNRQLALEHFKKRLFLIQKGADERRMGYEPGTKKIKRGGSFDDDFEMFTSKKPLIDIRHDKTFSPRKVNLVDFKHPPVNWRQTNERP